VLGRYNNANVTTGSVMVTGKDAASMSLNPLFVNASGITAVDFKPTATTLLGVTGTGITTDYAGTTRTLPTIGAWEVSGTTNAATALHTAKTIRIYPTLCTDKLNVNAESEISQIIVRNLVGQTVKIVAVNHTQTTVDITNVAAGNYSVTTQLTDGAITTQKIIKL
jgi:hypothetical protein